MAHGRQGSVESGQFATLVASDMPQQITSRPALALHARITEIRKAGWFRKMGEADTKVFGVLQTYADWSECTAWPSMKRIADDTGLALGTVKNTIARLRDWKLLTVRKKKIPTGAEGNLYEITVPREKPVMPSAPPPPRQSAAGHSPVTGHRGMTGHSGMTVTSESPEGSLDEAEEGSSRSDPNVLGSVTPEELMNSETPQCAAQGETQQSELDQLKSMMAAMNAKMEKLMGKAPVSDDTPSMTFSDMKAQLAVGRLNAPSPVPHRLRGHLGS